MHRVLHVCVRTKHFVRLYIDMETLCCFCSWSRLVCLCSCPGPRWWCSAYCFRVAYLIVLGLISLFHVLLSPQGKWCTVLVVSPG